MLLHFVIFHFHRTAMNIACYSLIIKAYRKVSHIHKAVTTQEDIVKADIFKVQGANPPLAKESLLASAYNTTINPF